MVAGTPWLLSSCSPRPLLPRQLKEERAQYETRAASAQQATLDAQRVATSPPPRVVPIGTARPSSGASNSVPTMEIFTATLTVTHQITQAIVDIESSETVSQALVLVDKLPTATLADSTVRILRSATVTQTSTPISEIIIVRSTPIPDDPITVTTTSVLAITGTEPSGVESPTVGQSGKSVIEDIITNEMLSEQVQKSIKDDSLSDIVVKITPDGMRVSGKVTLVTLLKRPFEMTGTFEVENESLAVKVDSILLNGSDVTEQYRSQLEDEIRWQLYQLLPQRFVQSFDLAEGEITVQSRKR